MGRYHAPGVEAMHKGRRCSVHGLALGPEGMCVLCRRNSSSTQRPRASVGSLLGAVALVCCALMAWYLLRSPGAARVVSVPEAIPEPIERRSAEPARREAEAQPSAEVHSRDDLEVEVGDSEAAMAETTAEATPVASIPRPVAEPLSDPKKLTTRAQHALSQVSIKLYTTSWCPSCRRARTWLTASGLRFVEHDVERSATAERHLRRLNPEGSVPTIDVDGRILVGFGEQSLGAAIADALERRLQPSP